MNFLYRLIEKKNVTKYNMCTYVDVGTCHVYYGCILKSCVE